MNFTEDIKIKYMTKSEIVISVDRLTRFKEPEIKYLRVFKDIISNHLINPSIKKNEIENIDFNVLKLFVEKIINKSLENLGFPPTNNLLINQKIYEYENSTFKINDDINLLLKNKINYASIINLLEDDLPFNLRWLKTLERNDSPEDFREKYSLRYPIREVILAEGITEEILLPKFAKILGVDFNKKGIYVISAGGKNQVVKYFYRFAESLKIPIFVLLDKDASSNLEQIKPKLRTQDSVHILESGEFEDLFPPKLINKALDAEMKNISIINDDIMLKSIPMSKKLEELFKTRGMHEFKKSEFAAAINELNLTESDLSDEIKLVISEIYNKKNPLN